MESNLTSSTTLKLSIKLSQEAKNSRKIGKVWSTPCINFFELVHASEAKDIVPAKYWHFLKREIWHCQILALFSVKFLATHCSCYFFECHFTFTSFILWKISVTDNSILNGPVWVRLCMKLLIIWWKINLKIIIIKLTNQFIHFVSFLWCMNTKCSF